MNNTSRISFENNAEKRAHENQDTGINPDETDNYPVLTEILPTLPDLADATQNEKAWNELEQRLSERILQRVEERIQFVLEEIIQQNLAASIQNMTGALVSEIKKDLQSTLDVVVTHTVTDELHRLRQKEFFSESNHLKITGKNWTGTDRVPNR